MAKKMDSTMYQYVVEITDDPNEYGPQKKFYSTAKTEKTARKKLMHELAEQYPECELNVIRVEEVGAVMQ